MAKRYRIVFFGSSAFACPSLDRLLETGSDDMPAVVCQCDKPSGRDRQTTPCVIRRHLAKHDIPVITPVNINTPESVKELKKLAPDIFVVVSYGQILKPEVLAVPSIGSVNVHGSLLPRLRGAAPIQWAIANGETATGVTTMLLNEQMDAGDILESMECPILPEDTAPTLHDRLAGLGASLLIRTLDNLRAGRAQPRPQEKALVTFAPKLKKQDGRMDWRRSASELRNRIRAFQPWPGAFFERPCASGKWVKALRAAVAPAQSDALPGVVLQIDSSGILVQTGAGGLLLLEIQPESRPAMKAVDFALGRSIKPGEQFG